MTFVVSISERLLPGQVPNTPSTFIDINPDSSAALSCTMLYRGGYAGFLRRYPAVRRREKALSTSACRTPLPTSPFFGHVTVNYGRFLGFEGRIMTRARTQSGGLFQRIYCGWLLPARSPTTSSRKRWASLPARAARSCRTS